MAAFPRTRNRPRLRALVVRILAPAMVALALTAIPAAAFAAAPNAYDGDYTLPMNTSESIDFFADDDDGDAVTLQLVSGPSHGSLTGCADLTCTYTPTTGYVGADQVVFRVSDGTSTSNTATVSLTVTDPSAPTADDSTADVDADGVTSVSLTGSGPDGTTLTFAVVANPSHGTLSGVEHEDCSGGFCETTVEYTTAGYKGPDSFTFTVSDGTRTSTPATMDLTVRAAPCSGKTVTNGTLLLGVNCVGDLNVGSDGLKFVPTGNDSVSPGCACEGWGVADATSLVSGYANQSAGDSDNLSVVSFTTTPTTAVSVVDIGTTFRVTQDYHPSPATNNAYEATVTIKNTSAAATHLRYRRVMDWDIEPTAFSEYVTLQQGSSPRVAFTSDDGFASADPLAGPSQILETGNFVDSGPDDHGALFDFDFGDLAAGATKQFEIYYGAAATEVGAVNALNSVNAEAYSLGEPSTDDGPTLGTPNTFLFGFKDIGGASVFAPVAKDDTGTAVAAKATDVDVLANDSDPNGDPLTISGKTNGAHGTVTCTAAKCTYTSAAGYVGSDAFTYTISDGNGGTATGTVTMTVTAPPNHPPVAENDTLGLASGASGTVDVLANDTDADNDTLTVTDKTNGAHGSVICVGTSCTYTSTAGYTGADSFTYTISDGHGGTATGTVNVTVTAAANHPPAAVSDTLTVAEDVGGSVNVLANDTDADSDTLAVTGRTNGAHGTVTCTATSCSYAPNANYNGPDSFTYTISDGHGGTATGTVNVTVTPVNDAPVAVNDTASTNEDTAASIDVTSNDTDVEGSALSATLASPASHGTATCSGGSCTYTPDANFNGTDSFTYRSSDGAANSAPATVSVTVKPVNDPPVAIDDNASSSGSAVSVSVLANDTDVDGDTLTVTAHGTPGHGSVTCTSTSCSYTPTAGFTGTDTFTYTVSDGHTGTATATVHLTVSSTPPVNHPPAAVSDTLTVAEDVGGSANVLANDTDADHDTLAVTGKTNGKHGTVTCSATSCSYAPSANYNGPDSFTYTISDGHGGTATGTVAVTVTAVNDAPIAVKDALSLAEDTSKSVTVLVNDTDVDGDSLKVTASSKPGHGTVSCTTAGKCTYKPVADYNGPDTFTYTVSDGHGGTATASVAVTVTPVADRPGAPKIGTASSGRAHHPLTAIARWSAPSSDGGAAILSYRVTAMRYNARGSVVWARTYVVSSPALHLEMKLAQGKYRFKVAAVNRVGAGSYSSRSNLVRPR